MIELPFNPRELFGAVRVPVKVNGYSYRSTIAAMGGPPCIPLRRSNREAAGLEGGERLEVRLELDDEPRVGEHVETIDEAKKPETRARRVANAVKMVRAMKRKKKR